MNITEQEVPKGILDSIKGCADDALNILGSAFANADPPTIVAAVDDFVYRWQKGERPPADVVEDGEQARLLFGSLWGEQIVKQFGWQWAKVTFHDYGDATAFGVFSPDRSLAIYPLDFMLGCIRDSNVDVTAMLSFEMLRAGQVPKMNKKSYINVMDGVRRIVPRE
ncbi:MAG TPA: hypothetical protein VMS17_30090 [Gemmataceae bacterium]|nr:hypothetical protein [Gemmataceae bacterium]